MHKTITLRLIESRPQLYEQLRTERKLMQTLNRYSRELKDRHEAWKESLSKSRPGSDEAQIATEAMELALQDLQELVDSLRPASPPNDDPPFETATA